MSNKLKQKKTRFTIDKQIDPCLYNVITSSAVEEIHEYLPHVAIIDLLVIWCSSMAIMKSSTVVATETQHEQTKTFAVKPLACGSWFHLGLNILTSLTLHVYRLWKIAVDLLN